MKIKEFKFPKDINGYISQSEGKLLFELSQLNLHLGSIVELGAFHGRSTVCLAQGSKSVDGGEVYAVDNFTGDKYVGVRSDFYPEFVKNIKRWKLEDQIIALKGDSVAIGKKWREPIRFLFLDADHSYEKVSLDAKTWGKHIVPGGIIAFHDSFCWIGVYRFIIKFIISGDFKNFKTLAKDSMGITYAFKRAKGETITKFERSESLLKFIFISLPKIPVLIRVCASERDESDFWFRFFESLSKFYRKMERIIKR